MMMSNHFQYPATRAQYVTRLPYPKLSVSCDGSTPLQHLLSEITGPDDWIFQYPQTDRPPCNPTVEKVPGMLLKLSVSSNGSTPLQQSIAYSSTCVDVCFQYPQTDRPFLQRCILLVAILLQVAFSIPRRIDPSATPADLHFPWCSRSDFQYPATDRPPATHQCRSRFFPQ